MGKISKKIKMIIPTITFRTLTPFDSRKCWFRGHAWKPNHPAAETHRRHLGRGWAGGAYRRDDEEFAAHQVEDSHGASTVSVCQQGTVMTPHHLSPLRWWVLRHYHPKITKTGISTMFSLAGLCVYIKHKQPIVAVRVLTASTVTRGLLWEHVNINRKTADNRQ